MSLKSKFVSAFASAMVLGSVAIVASAQDQQTPAVKDGVEKSQKFGRKGFGKRGGFGKGMRGGRFGGLRGIELTEAQKEQIKQIREANRPDAAAMEELKAIREARRAGTLTDEQKARAQALREQARQKGDAVRQQMLAILTPEQRQQLETRKADIQKRRQEHREMRKQKRQGVPPANPSDNN